MRPHIRWRQAVLLALAVLVLLAAGCGKKNTVDPFVEKWKRMATQSTGHSVAPDAAKPSVEDRVEEPVLIGEEKAAPEPTLPTTRVTLVQRNASLKALIMAMAQAAKVGVILSPNVADAPTNLVTDKPWDMAFTALLKTHGLRYEWEGQLLRIMTLEDMEHDLKVEEIAQKRLATKWQAQQTEPMYTSLVPIKFADAKSLAENLAKFLTMDTNGKPRGSVVMDPHSNALIIQAGNTDVRRLVKLVARLDKPSAQVRLKAHIVETTTETARELGIQWGGSYARVPVGGKSSDALIISPGSTSTYDSTASPALSRTANLGTGTLGEGLGLNFPASSVIANQVGAQLGLAYGLVGGNLLEVELSALQQDDKLKILSSPSITTLDNQVAFTENGARVPFVTIDEDGNKEVKFEDAVLRLEMTPHIIDDHNLKLKILVKKDEVDTTRTVEGNPFIIKKQTETSLIAGNNETIVISGLTKKLSSESESGVPGVKDVPILGWLFKGQTTDESLEEVLIFITPTILDRWKPHEIQKSMEQIEKEIEQENKQKEGKKDKD